MRRKAKNLSKRGHTYWGRVEIDGTVYRASLRTANQTEAKTRLEAWKQKLERRSLGFPEDYTFQAAVVRWGETVLPGSVKPNVAKRYLVSIGQLLPAFGSLTMSQITTRTISDYLESRAGKVSNGTLQNDLTALSRLLSACVAWGWRQDNPARFYDRTLIRAVREPVRPPTEAELETLLSYAPEGMAAVLRLLHATGMRENEVVTLERADVDWAGGKITLTRTKTNRPRALDWRTPAGDAGPVLAEVSNRIGYLFLSDVGNLYTNFASNFTQLRARAIAEEKAAGRTLRRFRVHDLRHGFAIRWLKAGGSIYKLQKHLGHSSIKTTEGYLGYLTAQEQEAVETQMRVAG